MVIKVPLKKFSVSIVYLYQIKSTYIVDFSKVFHLNQQTYNFTYTPVIQIQTEIYVQKVSKYKYEVFVCF